MEGLFKLLKCLTKRVNEDCFEDGTEPVWRRYLKGLMTKLDSKQGDGKKIICL